MSRLAQRARLVLPELAVPCFAHLRVRTGGRDRDLLLGPQTSVGSEVTIIDWQRAPLAEVFFSCREGDEYELEIDDRPATGRLVHRHLLGYEGREVVEIEGDGALWSRRGRDDWVALAQSRKAMLAPRGRLARKRPTSPVRVILDPQQQRAVESPENRSMRVLGEAGFGKTVVALHRLAFLRRRAHDAGRGFRALVILPTEGLRRLCLSMLDELGIEDAEVRTFDAWIAEQARRVFVELPARDSRDAGAAVVRFKRHPQLHAAIDEVAQKYTGAASCRDLLHLFGDRALLEKVAQASGGALTRRVLAQVLAHTRVQFSATTEEAYAHVDLDRLETVDGRTIDDGTPMQDAGSIDVEDCPVLFALQRARTGTDATPAGSLTRYDHLVIDEAQELAPLELAVLGRAVATGGTLTVAGDENQQIDETAYFSSWRETMARLGLLESDAFEAVTLETSYRCPADVEGFARGLVGGRAPNELRRSHAGASVRFSRFESECHLCARLTDELLVLRERDPRATVAIICRTDATARRLGAALVRGLDVRLALAGAFEFEPGVNITSVAEVKGLEFDYVVAPDASAAMYPDTSESRRALYVVATRAMHRLWLATATSWSPLVDG